MTFARQNTQADAHAQLDYALERGVNFIDTAEMYPVPFLLEKQGHTETYIGNWLQQSGKRDQITLATKVTGPGRGVFKEMRTHLDFRKSSLDEALNNSLRRLKTDYIDLYQLHWPERDVNVFGKRDYDHAQNAGWEDNFAALLDRLEEYVKQGKVRYLGVSNETPFGLMRYMEENRNGKVRVVSVQNAYSLIQRRDEVGMSEVVQMEEVGYLAYSPLAFGVLSGKYLDNNKPGQARVTLFPNYNRYSSAASMQATQAYAEVAKKHGLSLAQMALSFVTDRPFVTSNIIGATSLDQLKENIDSVELRLDGQVLKDIQKVHSRIPNPAP
jgi:aryl-alcohol dehydrogenase-like predicted oxidoreductase